MSDEQQPTTKPRPQAGEFWQSGNTRLYIVGRTLYGRLIVQTQDGDVREQVLGDWFHLVPNCTGFDTSPRNVVMRAFRECCYRWSCPNCGVVNRCGELSAGFANECVACHAMAKVSEIEFNNGAVMVTA